MRLGLVRPTRRDGTSSLQFVKRIPQDVKPQLVGKVMVIPVGDETVEVRIGTKTQAIRFSLKTPDVREAKHRQAEALAYVEQYLEALRSKKPLELTHRQITALAGMFYAVKASGPDRTLNADAATREIAPLEDDYEAELLAGVSELLKSQAEEGGEEYLQRTYGPVVDRLLAEHNVPLITESTRRRLVSAFGKAMSDALVVASRYASGDYSPDTNLQRFPAWEEPTASGEPPKGYLGLIELLDLWWVEAKAAGGAIATYEQYGMRFNYLIRFLGHDDARRVTHADLIRYKDHRLGATSTKTGKPISASTVKTGDFVAYRSVFRWACENGYLPTNPTVGLRVKAPRVEKVREREFTEEEASAILKATRGLAAIRKPTENDLARRWVPWICAYSGCRVGEAVQLRKEDFTKRSGSWVMTITPEAGTVKNKQAREVPIHAHLIEEGLMDFIKKAKDGHLFVTVKEDDTFRHTWRGRKNRVAEWVRTIVPDPNVAPNHAWRHAFKSRGFEAGIQEKVLDAICGHAPSSVGRQYGSVTLKTKVEAIEAFPRYVV